MFHFNAIQLVTYRNGGGGGGGGGGVKYTFFKVFSITVLYILSFKPHIQQYYKKRNRIWTNL